MGVLTGNTLGTIGTLGTLYYFVLERLYCLTKILLLSSLLRVLDGEMQQALPGSRLSFINTTIDDISFDL